MVSDLFTGDALSAESRIFIDKIARRGIPTVAKPFDFDDVARIVRQMLAAIP